MVVLVGVILLPLGAHNGFCADDAQGTPSSHSVTSSASSSRSDPSRDPRQVIAQHIAVGRALLEQGQYAAARVRFRAALEIDATQPEALRLLTQAQRQLDAQQAKTEQNRSRLRQQALDLAINVAREKEQQRTRRQTLAREQLVRAREQQIKFLYKRGVDLYRQGDLQAAVDTLQRMVVLEPTHPLVRDAQRLMAQAELKQAGVRARASARLLPSAGPAVPELEDQLAAKRIEIETTIKYAKAALKDRRYDSAIELSQRALAQDPQNRQASQLLQEAQLAKLKSEESRLKDQVARDEQSMVNEVVKAQVLPEATQVTLPLPLSGSAVSPTMNAKLQQPISLNFKDVALSDVIEFLGDAANISIIPSPQLDLKTRRVSLNVTDLPLDLALKYLVKNQSLAYRVERDAVLIATPEEFSSEPLQTRVMFLRNGLGPFALQTAAIEANPALTMQTLKELIEKTVPQTPDSKLVVDERSGALVATNTAENLALTERLLTQLDVAPLQVLIEARFIELTNTDLEHVGLESVLNGNVSLTKKGAGNGTRDAGLQIASGGGEKFAALAREDEGLNLTLQGVLTGTQFESVLHLLEESKKTKTLSAPRVTALNNRTATIRVVEEFNYPTKYEVSLIQFDINGDGDFDDAGETEFANVPKDFQKRDIGILLNVTPSVGKDLKTITLVLAPEVSQFSQFRDLGGGVTVPEFTSSQLTTSVVVGDGQTAVLGGLMKDSTSRQVTKVPWLGDLPVVGGLFRQTEESNTRKNLLIFITAHMLRPRSDTT